MAEKIIGIDLGTTNSVVAVMIGDEPVVIANQEGSRLTPSVVSWTKEKEVLVGEPAKRRAILDPENTVYESTLPNNYFKITIDDNNKRQAFILKLSRQGKGLKPHENMALSYEVCLWKVFSFGAYGKSYMGASSRCRELGW